MLLWTVVLVYNKVGVFLKLNKSMYLELLVSLGLVGCITVGAVKVSDNMITDVNASNTQNHSGYWNINDFGARPNDPDFDNATVFNKMLDMMGKHGGTIYIPTGTYYIKSPININKSYVSIVGDNSGLRSGIDAGTDKFQAGGGGAQLLLSSGVTGFKLHADNTRLSGITFKGFQIKGENNNGFGIKGETDIDGVTISDMVITNVGMGVELRGADAASIHNNWIAETQNCLKLSGASQQANISNNSMGAQPTGVTMDLENPDRATITGNNLYPDGSAVINMYNPVHSVVTGNTLSSYYNGVINVLANSNGIYGNSNVISNNVISVEDWKDNPVDRDSKWGVLHIEGFTNRIDGNSIVVNNAPKDYTGILVMHGDNNRLNANSVGLSGNPSRHKIVINGKSSHNRVTNSVDDAEFDNGGNSTNLNK